MVPNKFQELLDRARKRLEAAKQEEAAAEAAKLSTKITMEGVSDVDLTKAGIDEANTQTDEGRSNAVDIIADVISNISAGSDISDQSGKQVLGVARDVALNSKQQEAYNRAIAGESIVLIGAAGTGKTTATGRITKGLISSGHIRNLGNATKWLHIGKPGIAIVAYTRKAVNNIRHAVDNELKAHTVTIHKLLEFAPVFYEIEDPEKPGMFKKTMVFQPTRNHTNPLPPDLKLIIHEESSMESVELYHLLQEAMPHEHQEIFLGDIQQLPPIFGMAILGFKMLELPVIELTEVYRQALESPIIALAHKVLGGDKNDFHPKTEKYINEKGQHRIRVPSLDKLSVENDKGSVKLQVWQKRLTPDTGCNTFIQQINAWIRQGYFNHEQDIILCPFNKSFGTLEINKGISQYLGTQRKAVVYEVIAGFREHYLAIGDRVLYDKEDAVITDIQINGAYLGSRRPQPASSNLDRWGIQQTELSDEEKVHHLAEEEANEADLDKFLEAMSSAEEDRVQAASHVVTLKLTYGEGEEVKLDSASEINALLGGYAITIHKSQGSEYEKVIVVLHHSHSNMVCRELLYTAFTRPKRHLHVILEVDTLYKGVQVQKIEGNTIKEKAEFFIGKSKEYEKKKKEMMEKKNQASEFRPDTAQAARKDTAIVIAESQADKPKLVKIADLVPAHIKLQFMDHLRRYWKQAKDIFGEEIGAVPGLSFNLQRHNVLGTANYKKHLISINPVWAIASQRNTEIAIEMCRTTMIHEICHLVAAKYAYGHGHSSGWIMSMKLMGVPADVTYTGDTLPPWMETYKQIIEETKAEIREQNGDFAETELEDGDVT